MGFRLSFGFGPLRYSKSLSGKKRKHRKKTAGPTRSQRKAAQATAEVTRDMAALHEHYRRQVQVESDANRWARGLMRRTGWTFRHICQDCGLQIASGAQSHKCEKTPGWSWDTDVTTWLMDGDRRIVALTGYQTGWNALEAAQASPEVKATELTDAEAAECNRIQAEWKQLRPGN